MSYAEMNGQVVLTMSHEDYQMLLFALGIATGSALKDAKPIKPILEFMNRLNQGNPNYSAYQVEK